MKTHLNISSLSRRYLIRNIGMLISGFFLCPKKMSGSIIEFKENSLFQKYKYSEKKYLKNFMDEDFLLNSLYAKILYHNYAKTLPIIDYHNHLSPKDIADNRIFENPTQAWINGDHYKYRAMRTFGINEKYITGDASDKEKFLKWAEVVPFTIRNPLYHWTHLELQRFFDIKKLLNPITADDIYEEMSIKLQSSDFSVRNLLKRMKVESLCTTDEPIDSLKHHAVLKEEDFAINVLPAWRPDKYLSIENTIDFNSSVDKLSEISNIDIKSYSMFKNALRKRHDFFADNGCTISDYSMETVYAKDFSAKEVEQIFLKVRNGGELNENEILSYKSAILFEFGIMDNEKKWVQQFHIGPLRNNNTRQYNILGSDTGFDSICDNQIAHSLSKHLDRLDKNNQLTKTIIYNLNPKDNEVIAAMIGNFQDGIIPGKMQYGSAWWFLDQKDGIEKQLNTLSNLGLLSQFIGMLTDSRSFLSFSRHEYFRRILCNLIGNDVENGELPNDIELLGKIVEDICYYNAKNFFAFK
jgi:glucuronate isomerase